MLKIEVDRLSLQKLEYEMKRADIPEDYNCFEIGYCVHPTFPYSHIPIFRKKSIHSFMIHSTTKGTIGLLIYIFTDLIKTHPERI